jgi:hypothetical protein
MHPRLLEDALYLVRYDQWASSIVNSDVFRTRLKMIQPGANRILTMFATGNDRSNFFEIFVTHDCFDLIESIFACNDNDPANATRALKCTYGMRDDWPAGDRRRQFVETHAATVTGGDENSCKHRQKLKIKRSYKVGAGKGNSLFNFLTVVTS